MTKHTLTHTQTPEPKFTHVYTNTPKHTRTHNHAHIQKTFTHAQVGTELMPDDTEIEENDERRAIHMQKHPSSLSELRDVDKSTRDINSATIIRNVAL